MARLTTRNVEVYRERDIYAGWPANHGAWQLGDEMLVGFLRGPFDPKRSGHRIGLPREKMLARSLDGGETWTVEEPNVSFDAEALIRERPLLDVTRDIIRCSGSYDHGGETAAPGGGFYVSRNLGRTWTGAFRFEGMEYEPGIGTMRTAVLSSRNLIFLSYAEEWFADYTLCVAIRETSHQFEVRSRITLDAPRAVMPAVAEVGDRICVALRRRMLRSCWIDLHVSDDNGQTWAHASDVADTGDHNGNPPALISVGRRLFCAYANRTECTLNLKESTDGGVTWGAARILRAGGNPDIGYPRLLARADGQLVCLYYWSDNVEPQYIAASIVPV